MSAELDALFDQAKSLAARPRAVRELPGGLTNRNYQVTTPDGTFVARISSGGGELLVIGYIEGRTFSPADVAAAENIPRIAEACRRLHSGGRFGNDFDMFDIQRRYLAVARSRGFRIPAGYDDLRPQFSAAEKALSARAAHTVPCNNDLLAANFIDDGDRIWLIDYEYLATTTPASSSATSGPSPIFHTTPSPSWSRHTTGGRGGAGSPGPGCSAWWACTA